MMTKEGCTKIVNFMTPEAGVLVLRHGHTSHKVKIHYFFFKSSLLPFIDQTNYVYSIDDQEGSTKIITFMTPWAGVLRLGHGHISQ